MKDKISIFNADYVKGIFKHWGIDPQYIQSLAQEAKEDLEHNFVPLSIGERPDWVSPEAFEILSDAYLFWWVKSDNRSKEIWESGGPQGPERDRFDRLSLLFYSKNMVPHWEKMSNLIQESTVSSHVWFALALDNSLKAVKINAVTQGKADVWKKELMKELQNIERLLESAPFGYSHWFNEAQKELAKKINGNYCAIGEALRENPLKRYISQGYMPTGKEIFSMAIKSLGKSDYDSGFYSSTINGITGAKIHFIRSLTCALEQLTGRPRRRLVAEVTSIAFDCSTDERDVNRHCKGLNPANHTSVVSDDSMRFHLRQFL